MGRRRACGSPSKAEVPRARAASGGTKRMTVPARPQSMSTWPMSCTQVHRGDAQLQGPVGRVDGFNAGAQRAQGADHQVRVAGGQRVGNARGAVGQGREQQVAVGQRLGRRDDDGSVNGVRGVRGVPRGVQGVLGAQRLPPGVEVSRGYGSAAGGWGECGSGSWSVAAPLPPAVGSVGRVQNHLRGTCPVHRLRPGDARHRAKVFPSWPQF